MAFSFGNSGNAMLGSAAGAGGLNAGPDLETIQTEVSSWMNFGDMLMSLFVVAVILIVCAPGPRIYLHRRRRESSSYFIMVIATFFYCLASEHRFSKRACRGRRSRPGHHCDN